MTHPPLQKWLSFICAPNLEKISYPHCKSPSIHINPMVKPPCFPPLLAHLWAIWATRHHASFHRRRTDPCPSPQTRGAGGDKRVHLKKWIGLRETKYSTTPYFMGKSMLLMGKSMVLMRKSMVLMGTSMVLIRKSMVAG